MKKEFSFIFYKKYVLIKNNSFKPRNILFLTIKRKTMETSKRFDVIIDSW